MSVHSYTAEATATTINLFARTGTSERGALLANTAGQQVLGICKNNMTVDKAVDIYDEPGDQAELMMAETCDEGALLKSDSSGHAIVVDTNATPQLQFYGARALEAGTNAARCRVMIEKGYVYK